MKGGPWSIADGNIPPTYEKRIGIYIDAEQVKGRIFVVTVDPDLSRGMKCGEEGDEN